jgi:hypothetical protein
MIVPSDRFILDLVCARGVIRMDGSFALSLVVL